jgi:hypothetical protein
MGNIEFTYSAVNTWKSIANHFKKTLCTFQKTPPKTPPHT